MLKLYNTLTRKKELFKPLNKKAVGLYTCGITSYYYAHIGNFRTYIFEDFLKRVLLYNDYTVKHVMNITDVGHLTSDADTGEDKVELEARKEGKSAGEIAAFYTKAFRDDMKQLNILDPDIWCKATQHIKEQIELVKILERKGFTYIIADDGVYFDTSKLKDYGKLAKLNIQGLKAGARIKTRGKRNLTDFALWKFSPQGKQRQMEWKSPWSVGFPGWHLECSAMAMKYLGKTFDIHCGGMDHIPVHHTNEIAQSEAATGKTFVHYWMHGAFLQLQQGRMGKSEGNILRISDLVQQGFDPLDFRYFCLTAHYRKPLEFSIEALQGARNSYQKLKERIFDFQEWDKGGTENADLYIQKFEERVNDDLDFPGALAVIWNMLNDLSIHNKKKHQALLQFDTILGLHLDKVHPRKIPSVIKKLAEEREHARKQKDWKRSDLLRQQIEDQGYSIEDLPEGYRLKPKAL